jgi:hypothetical protein
VERMKNGRRRVRREKREKEGGEKKRRDGENK